MLLFGGLVASGCAATRAARTVGGPWSECSWSWSEHYPGQPPCTFNSREEYQLARLWSALGASLAAQNAAQDERGLRGGSAPSSCETYLQGRPVAAEPIQRNFGSTGTCWNNGPALAQQCLSFCAERVGRSKTAQAEVAAQEARAVQIVEQAVAGLREREAAAVAMLQPADGRAADAGSGTPAEPPVELSDKCRRYVREFPARPKSFLDLFGSKGACWRSSTDSARQCNSKCGDLLTQAAMPDATSLAAAAAPL